MLLEITIFGIVWGILWIYFLIPFKNKTMIESEKYSERVFFNVFKGSLVKVAVHKKAILALVMLIITLIYIWFYHSQLDWYNHAHGVEDVAINPKLQAIYFMVSVIVYSVFLYIIVAIRRTLVFIKKPK